jgi:hypothetical protein
LLHKPRCAGHPAPSIPTPRHADQFRPVAQDARFNAGWSSPVARQAHNLKVIGSNPIPATTDSLTSAAGVRLSAFRATRFPIRHLRPPRLRRGDRPASTTRPIKEVKKGGATSSTRYGLHRLKFARADPAARVRFRCYSPEYKFEMERNRRCARQLSSVFCRSRLTLWFARRRHWFAICKSVALSILSSAVLAK